MTIYSIFNNLMWINPLTHPSTQPPTHTPIQKVGVCPQNHKSSNRIQLSQLDDDFTRFFNNLTWTDPLTHPSTHPPTKKTPTHGCGIFHRFQIFKTESKISQLVQVLSPFLLIWVGTPWGVGGWGWNWVGAPPHTCTCARACTHMHMHTHTHACMLNMIKHGCLHGGGHLQFPNMVILAFRACACMHMCVHMSRDTPHAPRCPPTHLPPPQSHRELQGAQNNQKVL